MLISSSKALAFVPGSLKTSCKGTKLEFVLLSSLPFSVDSKGFNWLEFAGGSGILGSVDSNGFVLGGGGGGGTNCSTLGDEAGGVSNGLNVEGGGGGGGKLLFSVWISGIEFCIGVGKMGLSSKGLKSVDAGGGGGKLLSKFGLLV
jgi:hypothetical protein